MYNVTIIEPNILYVVAGTQSVTYSGSTYIINQTFRGVNGVTGFTYAGVGSQLLYEVAELYSFGIEFEENLVDKIPFPETTLLNGFGVEFELNNNEKIVPDTTIIQGFAIEIEDYPFFAFSIIETRW